MELGSEEWRVPVRAFTERGLQSCGTTPLSFLDLSFPENTWESLLHPRWGEGRKLSCCCGSTGSEFPILGTMQAEVWLERSKTLGCLLKRWGVLPESDFCPSCSGRGSLAFLSPRDLLISTALTLRATWRQKRN